MVHIPVLVDEVLQYLDLSEGEKAIDCTAGQGGHTVRMAEVVGEEGGVLAIERDPIAATALVQKVLKQGMHDRIVVANGNYRDIADISQEEGFEGAQGILFDLGFSSWQIEESGRGFSFQKDEPLDMRYDPTDEESRSARDIVNGASREELENILREYGEEPRARLVAKAIADARKKAPIETTAQLSVIVALVTRARPGMNPATRTFQALRIAVNDELLVVKQGLEGARSVAGEGCRIVVISFHSLEDRIVKNEFRSWKEQGFGTILTKKVVTARYGETRENRRSRSAKLRAFLITNNQ
ncbi:MAG: 16S rRNA (cytosine(1402)-N(4))-methyltransferase RsmH [Candidatus Spechtbacterales bacterium]